ncbi:MAG: Wzz/FepE/Etk N-terminal domain-containing protein, partial [Desulforhabdus sp.]|nr:Wzz/FepE/Etk N-terminal domain-containing protein [Desulforhabdus sp.]
MQSTQQQPKFTEKTLRDAYFVLFRNKNKIMLCFAAVVLTVAIGTFFSPRIYQSDAKLMLRLGRESVSLDPTATIGQIAHIGQNRETEINSELEILNSRELAEKVVDAIGVENIIYGLQEESTAGTASPLLSKLRNAIKGLIRVPLIALVNLVESWSEPDPLGQLKQRELAINLLMKHLYTEAVKK